jgi:hypothetical protein
MTCASLILLRRTSGPDCDGLFKRTIAARCSQCVISSRVPYITLTDGVCNLCHEHNKLRANDEETLWQKKYVEHQRKELDHLLKSHQGKGRDRYDALVLFSGGKDSVYMLSRLRKEYPGLRVLLMTWDNGFYSNCRCNAARKSQPNSTSTTSSTNRARRFTRRCTAIR